MKLYVNGCSFSYGNTLENKLAWPDFIDDFDVVNESWIGSSNKRIIRRTIEYIQNNNIDNTFFVIQLSDWVRDEWYDTEFDTWIGMCKDSVVLDDKSYNRSDIDHEELHRKVKNYVQHSLLHRSIKTVEQETFNLVNTLVAFLNNNNVNYLITGMSSKCMPNDNDINILMPTNFIKPISIVAGNNVISNTDSHPDEAGHKLFARYIIDEIKNYERFTKL